MEEQNDEIKLTDEDMHMLRDVRAALLKQRHGQVNVDAAWEQFIHDEKSQVRSEKPARLRYIGLGVLMGVAASLLLFVVLCPMMNNKGEDETLLVSEFIDQKGSQVEMISTRDGQQVKEKVTSAVSALQQSETGVLDFRNQAASGVVEERIITTPRGKVQTIILADGTKVLLNNESRLRFPTRFTGNTRTVYVEGEAYFTVAKDAAHPFIVHSRDISTTALGTRFNVKAYKNKALCITLVDGSVRVTDDNHREIILKPGEEVSTVNDKLIIADADTRTYKQWEEGYFYYDNVPLIDILVELGRWYNVNIELKNRRLMNYRLHFIAARNTTIDDALERLNEFNYLHAERKGDKIIVSGK